MQTIPSRVTDFAAVGNVTLASSTVVEPLVANWPAWSYLLPPVTASLYFSNYQLPLLNSFIEQPESHAKAVADPRLSGGPFVDLPPSRVPEVVRFREDSLRTYSENKKFSEDLVSFLREFASSGDGLALAPWYERVPESFRPFVELVYDYHQRPHVRFIEPLLYQSSLYRKESQAVRLFNLNRDGDRSYFLNTPRLPAAGTTEVFLSAPFDGDTCKTVQELASGALPVTEVRERLSLSDDEFARLAQLMAPAQEDTGTTPGDVYTYLGHASVMIHWKGTTIITDPVISVNPSDGGEPRYGFGDLPPRIDYVAITHNHHDHFSIETLLRLAPRIGTLLVPRTTGFVYGDVSLKAIAKRCNIGNVIEMDTLDSVPFPDGEIISVPFLGEHSDLAHSKNAYVVRTGRRFAFFGADSDNVNERVYSEVRKSVGAVDTMFIGTENVGGPLSWTCGPLLPSPPARQVNNSRRSNGCDAKRAQRIAEVLGSDRVYCYGMGLEPWVRHLLGAAMSAESPQLRTAQEFISTARGLGLEARLLHGTTSFS